VGAYLIRRFLWAIALFFAVTIVSYVLFFIIPADPAKQACGQSCNEQQVSVVRHFLGLDKPIYWQYGKFVGRMMPVSFRHKEKDGSLPIQAYPHFKTPSLGTSFFSRQPVTTLVLRAAPVTASLVLGGAVLWLLFAFPIGILSALRPRSLLDRASMTFVLIGISAHPVWIGLILAYFAGYKWHLTPITNYADFFNPPPGEPGGPVQWAYHLILPWATFAMLYCALYVRMIRANVMETMNEDYVRTARAKGAPESRVLRTHIVRNAMLPIVTILGMDIGYALGGAIFTENVFSLPGLGRISIQGYTNYDTPTVQGVIVFATVVIIGFNLLVDLVYAWVDPRIRLA
jgi:peptide/nickel transport system permease protein